MIEIVYACAKWNDSQLQWWNELTHGPSITLSLHSIMEPLLWWMEEQQFFACLTSYTIHNLCVSLPAGEMNNFNQVELILRDILRAINPSDDDWALRFHILNEVRNVVGSIESLRGLLCSPLSCFVLCSSWKVYLHLLLMHRKLRKGIPYSWSPCLQRG